MGKQAVGVVALNYPMRMDALTHALLHGAEAAGHDSHGRAIAHKRGTDRTQRDGGHHVLHRLQPRRLPHREQAGSDRGLFRSVKYQTHKDEERTNGADLEKFESPDTVEGCVGMQVGCYNKLRPDGILPVGARVKSGGVASARRS